MLPQRFWDKVKKTETCWLWVGAVTGRGYGAFSVGGKLRGAHRVAYEDLVGPVPSSLVLDHVCRVRQCVNPDHLRPVTQAENLTAPGSLHLSQVYASRDACASGHPYTPENTYLRKRRDGGTTRRCRTCHALYERRRQRERREGNR